VDCLKRKVRVSRRGREYERDREKRRRAGEGGGREVREVREENKKTTHGLSLTNAYTACPISASAV
jgi:hypothetical protein